MEQVKIVDLREGGGVVDTSLGRCLLEVAVTLDSILGGAQVGVDGVGTASGGWVLQLDVLTGAGNLCDGLDLLLQLSQLNVQELLQEEEKV